MPRKLQGAALAARERAADKVLPTHWRKDGERDSAGYAWCGAPTGRCGTGTGRGVATVTDDRRRVTCQACLNNHDRAKAKAER